MAHWTRPAIALLAIGILLAGCATSSSRRDASALRALAAEGPVSVTWDDPEQFSERFRRIGGIAAVERRDWVEVLAVHLRERIAPRLPAGQRVSIHIVDAAMAGAYEDVSGATTRDVRVLRDIHPPQITLRLSRIASDGRVLQEGEHRLRDTGYLSRSVTRHSRDALQHEKRMIDDWVTREFAPGHE